MRSAGFDEDFFAYADDAELGLRGRIAGWTCLYAPGAVVRHHRGATLGLGSARRLTLIERNRVLLVVKLFPWNLLWPNGAYYLDKNRGRDVGGAPQPGGNPPLFGDHGEDVGGNGAAARDAVGVAADSRDAAQAQGFPAEAPPDAPPDPQVAAAAPDHAARRFRRARRRYRYCCECRAARRGVQRRLPGLRIDGDAHAVFGDRPSVSHHRQNFPDRRVPQLPPDPPVSAAVARSNCAITIRRITGSFRKPPRPIRWSRRTGDSCCAITCGSSSGRCASRKRRAWCWTSAAAADCFCRCWPSGAR